MISDINKESFYGVWHIIIAILLSFFLFIIVFFLTNLTIAIIMSVTLFCIYYIALIWGIKRSHSVQSIIIEKEEKKHIPIWLSNPVIILLCIIIIGLFVYSIHFVMTFNNDFVIYLIALIIIFIFFIIVLILIIAQRSKKNELPLFPLKNKPQKNN